MIEENIIKQRLIKYRKELSKHKLDGFLVTSDVNIRYLSGFKGDSSWLLVTLENAYLITDSRYTEQARLETKECEIILVSFSLTKTFKELALASNSTVLGFDSRHMTVDQYQKVLIETANDIEITPCIDPSNFLRQIKDEEELSWLSKAAELGDQALAILKPKIQPGITEKHLSNHLSYIMTELGSERLAFDTIVASGERGALPHGFPTDKKIAKGDMITIDFGCVLEGYHSDMTRTFILGQPNKLQIERYNLILEAQMLAIEAISPQMNTRQIDAIARDKIKDAGFADYFGHGLGHSVGLEIHEDPRFSPIPDPINLEPGMVITVEPGIYIPGWGGLRIEDMVLVTEKGHDILTKFPKGLVDMTIIC